MRKLLLLILFTICTSCRQDDIIEEFVTSPQYGNRLALFGGSVALLAKPCCEYWTNTLQLSITNFSVSGAGFATKGNLIAEQVSRAISGNYGSFDIYLFWCSTNDLHKEVGNSLDLSDFELTDVSANITQCRGINKCFQMIYDANPNAKIILFTSLRQFGDHGYTTTALDNDTYLFQLVDAQIDCCKLWNIPYLDQFYTCPFNIDNYNYYYKDKVHPTNKGYELIMKNQAAFIANSY